MAAPPPAALALSVYVKLLRAAGAIDARVEPAIAAAGLTPTQFGVLEALAHKGPLTQAALGRKILTSPGNMTDVIGKLERRGLVRRGRAPGDRGARVGPLPAAGQTPIPSLLPPPPALFAGALAALAPAELETLGGLLRRLGRGAAGAGQPRVPGLAADRGGTHLGGKSFDIE